ncbi:GNAT family N-acetyltransferase [Desulfosarcina ovata]|uniref:BioF2-like acetyltransferase domain-containing protein n=1 Tax=Desulfosarcina ovata subsp. ovata TaxID=2752305 RepID=A0A5K8A7N7_9BACT|nr:GNAT family N-acetyltransferase [Desulfosarcina ovata]BBO88537.1 hypothetical protein DSCOOX_17170 [Desulfosarcina ovata subsp. ovata]
MEKRIEIVKNIDDILKKKNEWNQLLERSAISNVFLTWEWCVAWIYTYIQDFNDLFIIFLYIENELYGIAPFYLKYESIGITKVKKLLFIGTPYAGSDYMEIIQKKGKEKIVTDLLYNFLMNEGKHFWNKIDFIDVPSDSLFLMHFSNNIEHDGKYYELKKASYSPIATISSNEEKFFLKMSKSFRKKFKQDVRVFHRNNTARHHTRSDKIVSSDIIKYFRFYKKMTDYESEKFKQLLIKYNKLCPDHAIIQIDYLEVDNRDVAALLHLRYKNILSMYLMVIDKYYNPKISLGNIIVGLSIKNEINSEITEYDFLKGEESYKFHWSNKGKRSVSIKFWQDCTICKISALIEESKNIGKLILR